MNEQLKKSVIAIAEYMGYDGVTFNDNEAIAYLENISTWRETLKYHTSADALLEVWRKVRDDFYESDPQAKTYHINEIKDLICDGNYPTACIELAEIIKQLKEKV